MVTELSSEDKGYRPCPKGHPATDRYRDGRGHLKCRGCNRDKTNRRNRRLGGSPTAGGPANYRQGIEGVFQLAAAGLATAGTRSPVLLADAAAISVHGPGIAAALDALAREDPRVAAVLDRVLQVGPYGLVLAAVLPLAVQLAVNHKAVPAELGATMGAVPPDRLVEQVLGRAPTAGSQARRDATEDAYQGEHPDPVDDGARAAA